MNLSRVAVIIPALNEAENLSALLPILASLGPGQVIVGDNGSTDRTREVVEAGGADWVYEARRGYGAACHAAMQQLDSSMEIVAFVDADQSGVGEFLPALVAPILADESDLVMGARVAALREEGAATLPQRIGNWLLPRFVRWGWGYEFADLGPFRAIRRSSLDAIEMRDRAYGWTIEMQIRAVELGLRIREIPMAQRRRARGVNKISGTMKGVAKATYWLVRTCLVLWLTKRRRMRQGAVPSRARMVR